MTPEQARALFNEHREPGDLAHYGEKAAVAAILAATSNAEDFSLDARSDDAFMTSWCEMEAKGFAYGDEELENVHLGWLMARGHLVSA